MENQIFELKKEIEFSAIITNYSAKEIRDNVISLFVNSKRQAQQNISLPPFGSESVKLSAILKDKGLNEAVLSLEDDQVINDNNRYLAFYIPPVIKIALVSENENDIEYLKLSLQQSGSSDYFSLINLKPEFLNRQNLKDINVVILAGSLRSENQKYLSEKIQSGGSLLLFPSSKPNDKDYIEFCRLLKISGDFKSIEVNRNSGSVSE